jgi:MFS family permease
MAALTSGLPPAYWLLWVGTLINRLGGVVVPFLTLYLTSRRGVPAAQAALIVSLFGAGSFISQLVGGGLSDRWGRRPVMLLSFLSSPVAVLALGFATELPVIAICTFLLGLCTDLYRPAVNAAVADLVPGQARTRGYGYIYWAINLGAAVAPVFAGFLAGASYLALFILEASATFAFGLIVLFAFHETRPAQATVHAARTGLRVKLSQLTRAPILLVFSLLALLFGIIYTQGYVTLPLDMASHGLLPRHYGVAISVNGLLIILSTIPLSAMVVRWAHFRVLAVAGIVLGLGFGFTALSSTLPLFMGSVAIWTVGEILASAVAPTVVADLSPLELRGLYQGIFGAAWGLAYFLGPWLGGIVYQTRGATSLWVGCLALGAIVG